MQENEFEKRVEDKLAGLKLPPSDGVWTAVEAELSKKKRRRVIFFIFLLAGLGLAGYTSYTLLDRSAKTTLANEQNLPVRNESNNPPHSKNENVTRADNDHEKKNNIVTDEVKKEDNGQTAANTPLEEVKQTDSKIPGKAAVAKKEMIAVKDIKDQKVYNKKEKTVTPVTPDQKEVPGKKRNNTDDVADDVIKPGKQKNIVQQNDPAQPGINSRNDQPEGADKDGRSELKKEDTTSVADTLKVYAAVDSSAADLAKEESAQPKKIAAKKIKWGLDLSGGATFSRNQAFSVVNSGRVSAERAYYNNSPLVSGTPQNPGGIEPPSSVNAGPAFKAGVFAEMNLSKRSSMAAGLRYAYLSERMKVGSYRDTFYVANAYSSTAITNGVYGPARQKTFTNTYHFIELPLSYQLLLSNPRKMQVLWNAGVIAAYLINTNSLAYDTASGGIYYKQPDVVNRFHFHLHTGLSFRFAAKKNFAWSVGPELSLDMTRLMKQDIFTRQRYLFYGGLSAKIFLPSLKK